MNASFIPDCEEDFWSSLFKGKFLSKKLLISIKGNFLSRLRFWSIRKTQKWDCLKRDSWYVLLNICAIILYWIPSCNIQKYSVFYFSRVQKKSWNRDWGSHFQHQKTCSISRSSGYIQIGGRCSSSRLYSSRKWDARLSVRNDSGFDSRDRSNRIAESFNIFCLHPRIWPQDLDKTIKINKY